MNHAHLSGKRLQITAIIASVDCLSRCMHTKLGDSAGYTAASVLPKELVCIYAGSFQPDRRRANTIDEHPMAAGIATHAYLLMRRRLWRSAAMVLNIPELPWEAWPGFQAQAVIR